MVKILEFNLLDIDLFRQSDSRGELALMHSILLFLYFKHKNIITNEFNFVTFKYSEITWLNDITVRKIIFKLHKIGIINIIQTPKKHKPFIIELKPNCEIKNILTKNDKFDFKKYDNVQITKEILQEIIEVKNINEHFGVTTSQTWVRNLNKGIWDRRKFFIILVLVSNFNCSSDIKSKTVNKYMSNKMKSLNLVQCMEQLYNMIPENKQNTIFMKLKNSTTSQIEDNTFSSYIKEFIKETYKENLLN